MSNFFSRSFARLAWVGFGAAITLVLATQRDFFLEYRGVVLDVEKQEFNYRSDSNDSYKTIERTCMVFKLDGQNEPKLNCDVDEEMLNNFRPGDRFWKPRMVSRPLPAPRSGAPKSAWKRAYRKKPNPKPAPGATKNSVLEVGKEESGDEQLPEAKLTEEELGALPIVEGGTDAVEGGAAGSEDLPASPTPTSEETESADSAAEPSPAPRTSLSPQTAAPEPSPKPSGVEMPSLEELGLGSSVGSGQARPAPSPAKTAPRAPTGGSEKPRSSQNQATKPLQDELGATLDLLAPELDGLGTSDGDVDKKQKKGRKKKGRKKKR